MPRPPVPANLRQLCPPIDPVTTDDWDVLTRAYIKLILDYGECAARVQEQSAALTGAPE